MNRTCDEYASTIDYYNTHAEEYIERTFSHDMARLYEPFLAMMPEGGKILDAGSGSGRDTLFFLGRGYHVTPFDASPEMAKRSSAITGREVLNLSFAEVRFREEFDGVWASASLVHVPLRDMDDAVGRLTRSLVAGGVLYISFRLGMGERDDRGRHYTDFTESRLTKMMAGHPELRIRRLWTTGDIEEGRWRESWLNALVRKGEPSRRP